MSPRRRNRARIMYVTTNGQQCVLEGKFTGVEAGAQYHACVALGSQTRLATMNIEAASRSLAIAGVMVYGTITPWELLSWEVSCE